MNVNDLVGIDVHTDTEVSGQPADALWQPCELAASTYFKAERPTIPETIAYYRQRKARPSDLLGRQRVRNRRKTHLE
jgi:uncharacterized protein